MVHAATQSPSCPGRHLRTPLAWRNIVHDRKTMLISVLAVALAITIMFMELGFLNGLYDSQTAVFQVVHADLIMVSRGLHILNTHERFPRSRLQQVAGMPGVAGVYPIYMEDRLSELRNPVTGIANGVRALGVQAGDPVFSSADIQRATGQLLNPLTVIFDDSSRAFFGPLAAGDRVELAHRQVTVAGVFHLGPDYYYDGNLITGSDTFFSLFPGQSPDQLFLGLIQLHPGISPAAVLAHIARTPHPDVDVLTKTDLIKREKATWQKATPAGYIFTMGVAVGFIIGVFICYQILYTDIADHLPQLATLKAIGYQNRQILRLVLTQSVSLGLLGFLPAICLSFAVYSLLTKLTGIVTKLSFERVGLVLALTLAMCLLSGALAARKALAADPAELF